MTMDDSSQQSEARDLLYQLHNDYGSNAEHLENLHEMFLSFTRDYRRDDETHAGIIETYTALRRVLQRSDAIFER